MVDISRMTPQEKVDYLSSANAELISRCARLQRHLTGDADELPRSLGLRRRERQILALLLRTRLEWVSAEEIIETLSRDGRMTLVSLQSHISHIRTQAGIPVESQRYTGYRIPPEVRDQVAARVGLGGIG